jgi:hypothetical protein
MGASPLNIYPKLIEKQATEYVNEALLAALVRLGIRFVTE